MQHLIVMLIMLIWVKKEKNMTKKFKDLNLTLLDFKKNVDKDNLHYCNGFHFVIKEGIKHLLRLLYQTRRKLVRNDDEGNRAQVDRKIVLKKYATFF